MEKKAQQEAEDNVKQRKKSDEASKDGKSSPEIEKVTEVPRTIGLAGGISFIVGTIVGGSGFQFADLVKNIHAFKNPLRVQEVACV